MRFRNICFTLNNYTTAEESAILTIPFSYMVYGYEVGAVGATPHLQGYIELKNQMSLSTIKKYCNRLHIEKRQGTALQASDYCKKDGNFKEFGKISSPGKRNDLEELKQMVIDNKPHIDILNHDAAPRNLRFINEYKEAIEKEQTKAFRHVKCYVLWGEAGCGKTRFARELYPNIFTVNCGETFPFNGYDGESEILLDDFYGNIKYHEILRILDGHQYRVNVKGHHRYARWTTIFITSNNPPEDWYTLGLTDALKRRITEIVTM